MSAPGPAGGDYSTRQTSQLVERGLASSLPEPNTCYDLTVKPITKRQKITSLVEGNIQTSFLIAITNERFTVRRRPAPRAGSGVVRIDPLRFLAGCRTSLFLFYILACVIWYCCLLGPFLCNFSFHWYVCCLLVVLVKLSVLAEWLARKTCLCPHSFVFPWAVESSPLLFLALALLI